MPAITLAQVNGLEDVLITDRFTLQFGSIPGGTGNDIDQTLRCQEFYYPGRSIEFAPVGLHGFELNYRGRTLFPQQAQATYVETANAPVSLLLRNWQEYIAGTNSGNGAPKTSYAIAGATLSAYDQSGNAAMVARFYGIWPQDITDIPFSGQQTAAALVIVIFRYDWVEYTALGSGSVPKL